MFWKKKKVAQKQESKIILGMVILLDHKPVNKESFIKDFRSHYGERIKDLQGDGSSLVFTVDGEMVGVGHIDAPIPSGDIEGAAQYAYYWESALEELIEQKSHLVVSILAGGSDQVKRYRIFTQVLCSLLRTTNALAVYKGNQSLLLPKDDYLGEAELMGEDLLPLNIWIYFGARISDTGNSGYTYGLSEFNKRELEVVDSLRSIDDIRGLLFNIAHYVLDHDITFKSEETIGGSEEDRITLSLSEGRFVEGDTFKLEF